MHLFVQLAWENDSTTHLDVRPVDDICIMVLMVFDRVIAVSGFCECRCRRVCLLQARTSKTAVGYIGGCGEIYYGARSMEFVF